MSERKRVSWTWRHIKHEWRAVLFVTSVVTIFNLQFNWLKAIDSYAFVAIGNLSAIHAASAGEKPVAAVVLIDQPTHEEIYKERSPLHRCGLRDHLQAIYDAKPDAVAIDIDLSPALWLGPEASGGVADGADDGQRACQTEIENLIVTRATSGDGAVGGTATVLMSPFSASDDQGEIQKEREAWVAALLERGGGNVAFADPELPVSYGLTLSRAENQQSFAALLSGLLEDTRRQSDYIDPRKYRTGLELVPISLAPAGEPLRLAVEKALDHTARHHPDEKRVAFFGAAYGGGDDIFLTPLGEVYGVEAHAAAYASDEIGVHRFWDFLLDLVIAMSFGLVIAACWTKYFAARWSRDPTRRERAPFRIFALVGAMVLMTFAYGVLSHLALAFGGLWLSPIPIAIGMLIDSFVSGSVDEATRTHLGHAKRTDRLRHRLRSRLVEVRYYRRSIELAGAGVTHGVQQFVAVRTGASESGRKPVSVASRLWRVLGGEVVEYLRNDKPAAAGLAFLWALAWLGAVGWALWLITFGTA